jgi:hypothetical protein
MRSAILVSSVLLVAALAASPRARAAPAATCARAAPTASATIVISEVEADPVLAGADAAAEWLELTNVAASTATLVGWSIGDSAGADALPTVTVAAGRCVVVAATSSGFLAEHPGFAQPFVTVADGAIGNGLSNGGDAVTLRDGSGATVDCVAWGAGDGCFTPTAPVTAANTSATLQRTAAVDTDAAADWASGPETPCDVPAVAVRAAGFRAAPIGPHAVRLIWRAPRNPDVLGFHVWRVSPGSAARVDRRLISARGAGTYRFVDRFAPGAGVLRYRLAVVLTDGRAEWAASATVRAPARSAARGAGGCTVTSSSDQPKEAARGRTVHAARARGDPAPREPARVGTRGRRESAHCAATARRSGRQPDPEGRVGRNAFVSAGLRARR